MRLFALVAILFLFSHATSSATVVNCDTGESVQTAIDNAGSNPYVFIEITGQCRENVQIARDNVQIGHLSTATINTQIKGVVTVIGAQNIVLRDIVIVDSGSNSSFGVEAQNGAAIEIQNANIHGHPFGSVQVAHGSTASIVNSYLEDTLGSGQTLIVRDNSHLRLIQSEVIARNTAPFAVALGLYRGSTARVEQGNKISTSAKSPNLTIGIAVLATDNSDLRIENTSNRILGKVRLQNSVSADLRDIVIQGSLLADLLSVVEFSGTSKIAGTVFVKRRSAFSRGSGATTFVRGVKCISHSAFYGNRSDILVEQCG